MATSQDRPIRHFLARVALVCAFAAATANAQTKPNAGIWVEGGLTDCGDWVSARRSDRASNLEHYSLGLLNGMSLGEGKDFWRAGSSSGPVSKEAVYLWIDNYCAANPLEKVTTGVAKLFHERTTPRR